MYSNYRETIFGTLRVERLSEVQCVFKTIIWNIESREPKVVLFSVVKMY